jgi:rhodanese-related sulfurtransferase
MNQQEEILQLAQQRALENHLPYAGALTPNEAFEVLQENSQAMLVDVRSQAELALVGRVPNALNLEWAFYPGMLPNPDFAKQLAAQLDRNLPVIFMCRTGGRSHSAALVAQQLGFAHAYNMLEGFEGEANELKQRTMINGWKHANLPWNN